MRAVKRSLKLTPNGWRQHGRRKKVTYNRRALRWKNTRLPGRSIVSLVCLQDRLWQQGILS